MFLLLLNGIICPIVVGITLQVSSYLLAKFFDKHKKITLLEPLKTNNAKKLKDTSAKVSFFVHYFVQVKLYIILVVF
ncbi:hypothetical protein N581_05985 [Lactobacillus jensenii MD IIE-70(2)]|nr:hypothetical protein N581_05985 [Lactobacillus jensenii MD IIE-70(2)]